MPVLVFVAAVDLGHAGALPAAVATHFGPGGLANGWMTRDGYVAFMPRSARCCRSSSCAMAGLPRVSQRCVKMPQSRALARARPRAATLAWLRPRSARHRALMAAFLIGLHLLIVARTRHAAAARRAAFFALLVAFVVGDRRRG